MKIEGAGASRGISLLNVGGNAWGAADINLPTPALPEEEFNQPLGLPQIGPGLWVIVGENSCFKTRHGAGGSL